ncbi:MAG: glycosyltransferase family 2 protein [Halobacteriota archaeon]
MNAKPTVAVLIPTLNEEATIGDVIGRIPIEQLASEGYETAVYVIDGDSRDGTQRRAREKGATVVPANRSGKGAAIQQAFASIQANYFIMIDGDNTYPPERIVDFMHLLYTYDVVLGSRLEGRIEEGAMTRTNAFGNKILTVMARMLFDRKITDLCTGFWGYRSVVIQEMSLTAEGFEIEADMFVECARQGFRIGELAINYSRRVDQPKLSSISDGFKIGAFLLKRWMAEGGKKQRELRT